MIRAGVESVLAAFCAIAAVATAVWPTWIESLTGLEPDQGTGETEWWLVVVLGLVALAAAALARRDLRAARRAPGGQPPA